MQVRQQKIASFICDNSDNDDALVYIEKNAPLLQGFLLIFSHEMSQELIERCKDWKLCFSVSAECKLNQKNSLETPTKKKEVQDENSVAKKPNQQIFRNIRSGESLHSQGDLLIHGNINDGAFISTAGSLTVFGIIQGDINCEGEYLIFSICNRGKIIFQGVQVNEYIENDRLKMITKIDEKILVKELD